MVITIPDDKWKSFNVESLRISGYRSMRNKRVKRKEGEKI